MTQPINLVTPATLCGFRARKSKLIWKRVVLLAFVVVVAMTGWLAVEKNEIDKIVASELGSGDGPRAVLAEHQELKKQLSKISKVELEQLRLRSSHPPLSLFALLAELKEELDGELLVERFDYSLNQLSSVQKAPNDSGSNGKVTLQLVTTSTIKSSSLIERLANSGYFTDVQLSTAMVKVDAKSDDLRFSVACKF